MSNITPPGLTKKRIAAIKRDLCLVAAYELLEAKRTRAPADKLTDLEHNALDALLAWAVAERTSGAIP